MVVYLNDYGLEQYLQANKKKMYSKYMLLFLFLVKFEIGNEKVEKFAFLKKIELC